MPKDDDPLEEEKEEKVSRLACAADDDVDVEPLDEVLGGRAEDVDDRREDLWRVDDEDLEDTVDIDAEVDSLGFLESPEGPGSDMDARATSLDANRERLMLLCLLEA